MNENKTTSPQEDNVEMTFWHWLFVAVLVLVICMPSLVGTVLTTFVTIVSTAAALAVGVCVAYHIVRAYIKSDKASLFSTACAA